MPHNLAADPNSGETMMFYAGQMPWHRLGTKLDRPVTSAKAMQAAHLDWQVIKTPLSLETAKSSVRLEGHFAIMREDYYQSGRSDYFGIVTKDYQPLQNQEAFAFFDDIVGQKAAIYHTAGALGKGERVWILAKLPDDIQVIGDDICEKYLLLSNSHDGKSSVQVKFTPIRVVCQITLTLALQQGPTINIKHTRNLHERLLQAQNLLGIVKTGYATIAEQFQAMTRIRLNDEQAIDYYRIIFPDPQNPKHIEALEEAHRHRHETLVLFHEGYGNQAPPTAGTLWAAYNGLTQYIDHRNSLIGDSRRLHSIWFGQGASIKARAYQAALDIVR